MQIDLNYNLFRQLAIFYHKRFLNSKYCWIGSDVICVDGFWELIIDGVYYRLYSGQPTHTLRYWYGISLVIQTLLGFGWKFWFLDSLREFYKSPFFLRNLKTILCLMSNQKFKSLKWSKVDNHKIRFTLKFSLNHSTKLNLAF